MSQCSIMSLHHEIHGIKRMTNICILGEFSKMGRATISFVMSVRPSIVSPSFRMEQLGSQWTEFL